MTAVTFILDRGESISADDLDHCSLEPVKKAILLAQRNHIRRRLGNLSCREHDQCPRVTAAGSSPDQLTISIQGCCRQLVDDAMMMLDAGKSTYALTVRQDEPAEVLMAGQLSSGGQTARPAGSCTAGDGTSAVEEREDASRLTDDDALKLEAIRRQLDMEFPAVAGTGQAGWQTEGDRGTPEETHPSEETRSLEETHPPNRARLVGIVLGLLLLVAVVGSMAAGALTTTWYVRSVEPLAVADREELRPILESVRPRSVPPRASLSPSPLATREPATLTEPPRAVQAP
jgi:hypothetical protein